MTGDLSDRITFDLSRFGGRPCTRGYRLRVADVPDILAEGATTDEIIADYDFLQSDDIRA